MKKLFLALLSLFFTSFLIFNVIAAEEDRHGGVETSAEHKSDQGLEQGKAYAGSKEKKSKDDSDEDESAKKEKKDKKDKSDNEDKELKDKKEKKEKKEK